MDHIIGSDPQWPDVVIIDHCVKETSGHRGGELLMDSTLNVSKSRTEIRKFSQNSENLKVIDINPRLDGLYHLASLVVVTCTRSCHVTFLS